MNKLGNLVVKHRKFILIVALLLLIPSFIGMNSTRINYDILVYLPEDVETIQGENILSDEFNMGAYAIILLDDMDTKDILSLEKDIKNIDTVEIVASIADLVGTNVPIKEILPDNLKDTIYSENETMMLVTFKGQISEDSTLEAVEQIRDITDEHAKVGGMTSLVIDTKELSDSEILIYIVIAVILCLIILELALDSYIVPFLLLLNIGIAILYNMGTNIIFGNISYITKAISAVLQLGVTTDFAIFLYHSYIQEKSQNSDINKAMANAINQTLKSVFGSSLTTIAGFLALCSMNLTLGKDIGLVMAKGVLFGVICVVTVLPSLILACNTLIEKTRHKEIFPKFSKIKDFVINHYKVFAVLFIIILPIAFYGYSNTDVYYNLDSSLPDYLESINANNDLKENFDMVSMEMLLVDKNMEDSDVNKMVNEIEELDGIQWTLSYSKIADVIPFGALPEDISKIFVSDNYQMILIGSEYEMATDELNDQVSKINEIIDKYDEKSILAGEGPLMKDLVEIADHDFNSVNAFSIGIIFLIMIFVLKSGALPVLLILVIEFAIFINMGIPYYTGTILPFIASIIIGTIQLGATIDYAILITNKYINYRKDGDDKKSAISKALETSITSIIVSGLCFFGATFGVGLYTKIDMIGSLCTLMARGSIVSMICVICLLPSLLMIFDKLICKTTKDLKKVTN